MQGEYDAGSAFQPSVIAIDETTLAVDYVVRFDPGYSGGSNSAIDGMAVDGDDIFLSAKSSSFLGLGATIKGVLRFDHPS